MTIWQKFDGTNTAPATFAEALSVILGRRIHDQVSAFAHMKRERAKAPRASLLWPLRSLIDDIINLAYYSARGGAKGCEIALNCFIGATMLSTLDYYTGLEFDYSVGLRVWWPELLLATGLSAVGLGLCSAAGLVAYGIDKLKIRGPAEWKHYVWDEYIERSGMRKNTPLRVFHDVTLIKRFFPGATVVVHDLEQDLVSLDPVLEVSYTNPATGMCEFAYPDIWDNNTLLEPH